MVSGGISKQNYPCRAQSFCTVRPFLFANEGNEAVKVTSDRYKGVTEYLRWQLKQCRNYTYKGTLRSVANHAVQKQEIFTFSVYVCSLSYPACKTHAPYYVAISGLCRL